jgi:hypothetical protein
MASTQLNEGAIEALFHDPKGPVARIMEQKAYAVENAAKRLLLLPGNGRTYDTTFYRDSAGRLRKGRARVPHTASAPGEPPASDTGRLLTSIHHEMSDGPEGIEGRVGSDVEYAVYLELGTRDMLPRPFLRPALDIGLAE